MCVLDRRLKYCMNKTFGVQYFILSPIFEYFMGSVAEPDPLKYKGFRTSNLMLTNGAQRGALFSKIGASLFNFVSIKTNFKNFSSTLQFRIIQVAAVFILYQPQY